MDSKVKKYRLVLLGPTSDGGVQLVLSRPSGTLVRADLTDAELVELAKQANEVISRRFRDGRLQG